MKIILSTFLLVTFSTSQAVDSQIDTTKYCYINGLKYSPGARVDVEYSSLVCKRSTQDSQELSWAEEKE